MANPRTDKQGSATYGNGAVRLSWRLSTPGENLAFGTRVYWLNGQRQDCVEPCSDTWQACVETFGRTPLQLAGWSPVTEPDRG